MSSESASQTHPAGWHFDNSYVRLPQVLFTASNPVPVRDPEMVIFNHPLSLEMGLNPGVLDSKLGAAIFGGTQIPDGASSMAQAYAGHQFGHFTMLGDGRAILLGEHLTPEGKRLDVQLKGSGRTVYSRRGDGRASLGPMLREYVISEAMHGLGIPTTRSLVVVSTGEMVQREKALPGAVLTRVAASHIRVGTFEFAARLEDPEPLRALAEHTRQRHFPELADSPTPFIDMFRAIMDRQAELIAMWMRVGFIHGVMNTDNMALSGETIDYGPCAFLDAYEPNQVFSSIDQQGRYAFDNQPQIAQWNLARLAETLLPLLDSDPDIGLSLAKEAIEGFPAICRNHWLVGMRAKLGLFNEEASDEALVGDLLNWMQAHQADYTNTFRLLDPADSPDSGLVDWHERWKARLARQPQTPEDVSERMAANSPSVIPRNHKVEEALEAAVTRNDFTPIKTLLHVLSDPYTDQSNHEAYRDPPPFGSGDYQTFCGT